MQTFSVIMAGGGGTRFWPLSRQSMPKQILNISGNDVLINETIRRYEGIIDFDKTYIVTNAQQEKSLKELLIKEVPPENIFLEPVGRNTAPCILLAAMNIWKQHGDGIMCVFPADSYITMQEEFQRILKKACQAAQEDGKLITLGIKPTFPSTGYGYIHYESGAANEIYRVKEFVEKPPFEKARMYIKDGNYLWNSGIFIWKVSTIIENFKRFLPRIYEKLSEIQEDLGTAIMQKRIDEIYPQLQNISIDYGIMERSNEVLVIPCDFGWSDIGSWDAMGAIFPSDENGNIVRGEHIVIDTVDSIIYSSGRLVTTVGLKEMIVVSTEDALMVCPKDRAQDVKLIVEELKKQKRTNLL